MPSEYFAFQLLVTFLYFSTYLKVHTEESLGYQNLSATRSSKFTINEGIETIDVRGCCLLVYMYYVTGRDE